MISAAFTIDTRDADTVVRALALSTAKDSASFTIDTMAGQLNPDRMVRHHDELA